MICAVIDSKMEHIEYGSSGSEDAESTDDDNEVAEPEMPAFAKGDHVKAKLTGENPRIVDAIVLKVGTHMDYFNDGRFYVEYADKKRGSAKVFQQMRVWVTLGQLEAHVPKVSQPTSGNQLASAETAMTHESAQPLPANNEALQQFGPLPALAKHHQPRAKKLKTRDGRRGSTSAASSMSTSKKSVNDRVAEFPHETFVNSAGHLFCDACCTKIANKKSTIDNHIASKKHAEKLQEFKANIAIDAQLKIDIQKGALLGFSPKTN